MGFFQRFYPILLSNRNDEQSENSRVNVEHPMKLSTALERLERIQAFACTYQEAINGSDLNFFVVSISVKVFTLFRFLS